MFTVNRRLQSIATCLFSSALAVALVACGGSSSNSTTTGTTPTAPALSGSYVFSVNGTDPNDGLFDVAGVLTFDGKGNITSGVADYNLGSGIDMNVALSGTYTAAGTAAIVTLTDGVGTQDSFTLAFSSSGTSTISGFDGNGSGTLTSQTAGSTFTTSGTYTYSLSGLGENTLTSNGGFTVAGGTITAGTQDTTDGVVVTDYATITGILEPVQSTGRGQAAFNGYNFSYYPVTANSIVLVGLDDRSLIYGTAQKM